MTESAARNEWSARPAETTLRTRLAQWEKVAEALDVRDGVVKSCPVNKPGSRVGEDECPQCGSSTSGPCWLTVSADSALERAVREAVTTYRKLKGQSDGNG